MNHIVSIIRRHWIPLLWLNSVLLAATIYFVITSPRSWKANAQFILPISTGDLNANLGTLGNLKSGTDLGFTDQLNPITVQSEIITGEPVVARVWAADPERSLYSRLDSYKELFDVTPGTQSPIIVVEAKGSSPDLAYRRMTALIVVYQQRLNELRRDNSNARQQLAQEELGKARGDLNQAQQALAKFQRSTGLIGNSSEQTKELIEAISNLKTTQAQIIAEAQANETRAKVAAAGLGTTPQLAMNSLRLGENKEYQAIREKVSQVETALAEARGTYTEQSPLVQSLLLKRQELRRELNQRIATVTPNANAEKVDTTLGGNGSKDSRLEMLTELISTHTVAKGLQQQAGQLQTQLDEFSAELSSISKNQAELLDLQRKYEIAEGVYKGIIAQIQQAKINTFDSYPNVQLLEGPISDPVPESKRRLIALGAILASSFGSLALILFLEARKPLLSPKDLQQSEFPVLAAISRLKRPHVEHDLKADIEIDFQQLASTISSLKLENQRLMVTSSTGGEGKTTVTLGLALALVKFGFRVLVVDGDLQQAEMSRRLGHPPTKMKVNSEQILNHVYPGLDLENAKQTLVRVYPGLDLMPAPAIPQDKIAEFFARGSFERHLSVVQDSGCYDYVLVDSAPVGLASETTLMTTVVRNILFVVRAGTSDRYSVMDSVEQLTRHNAQIKGLVVNGVESRSEGYHYGRKRELVETEV